MTSALPAPDPKATKRHQVDIFQRPAFIVHNCQAVFERNLDSTVMNILYTTKQMLLLFSHHGKFQI
jgi:hypothetical protein